MALNTLVNYRKVVNGVGYLFALPLLDPPAAAGEATDVSLTLFLKDPDQTLYEPQQIENKSAKRAAGAEDAVTLDVTAGGATWLLPLIKPSGAKEVQHLIVSVRRMPAMQQGVVTSSSSSSNTSGAASGLEEHKQAAALREDLHRESRLRSFDASTVCENDDVALEGFDFTESDLEDADSEDEVNVQELNINHAYGNQITLTQYMDVLFKGDEPLEEVGSVDERLWDPLDWSVSISKGTWFRRTNFARAKRAQDWRQLMSNGLPCRIKDNHIKVAGRVIRVSGLKVMATNLIDGDARFRLRSIEESQPYACQPAAASAHASYILNAYTILVKQNGIAVHIYFPLGRPVEASWDFFLRDLAECSSVQTQQTLVYSEEPREGRGAVEAMGFGVRLRDGGARLPLYVVKNDKNKTQLKLPGRVEWPQRSRLRTGWAIFHSGSTVVDTRLTSKERRDIVLRVSKRDDGDYQDVEYAMRAIASFAPIKEEEWQPLTSELVDEATLLHILNAARVTFGRAVLKELPNAQSTSSPKEKKPRLA